MGRGNVQFFSQNGLQCGGFRLWIGADDIELGGQMCFQCCQVCETRQV